MKLFEAIVHIYEDENGDRYYFDGKKLIYIGTTHKNTIGDKGSKEDYDAWKKWHDEELEKDKAEHPEYYGKEETEEERAERHKKIDSFFNDEEMGKAARKEAEDRVKLEKEQEKKYRKLKDSKEAKLYTNGGDLTDFRQDLYRFIKDVVSKKFKTPTWKTPNQRYEGSGIIKRGSIKKPQKSIPVINVYFDQSTSWNDSDVKIGKDAIGVLNEYEKKGLIKIRVFYFSDDVTTTPVRGATHAGKKLIDHIRATRPNNVIVMTDWDFDHFDEITKAPNITVPGGVWLLFREGKQSERLQQHLKGASMSRKYNF